jgi:hypothetical protein
MMRFPVAILIALLLSLRCMSCLVQAEELGNRPVPFSLPQVQLRDGSHSKPAQPEQALSTQPIPCAPVQNAVLETVLSDGDLHSRVVRTGEFYLTRTEDTSGSGLLGYVDSLFTPDVVRIGKASVSCPLVTVIKRRNPLCLLSGFGTDRSLISYIFLQVTW